MNIKMFTKSLIVLGLMVMSIQAASIDHVKIEGSIATRNHVDISEIDISKLIEILEILKEFDLENFDIGQLTGDVNEIKLLITIILRILDVDNIEEILCVLDFALEYDREETLKNLKTLIELGPEFLRLHIERRQRLEECEAIGGENPSALEQIQKRRCISQVEVILGTQITIVTLRIRSATNYFRDIASNLNTCAGHLLPART